MSPPKDTQRIKRIYNSVSVVSEKMSSKLAARVAKLSAPGASVASAVATPVVASAVVPEASAVVTVQPVVQVPSLSGLNFMQLIELLDNVTKELKKQGKSAVKPSVKKAAKEGVEKKARVLTPAAQIRSEFNMHVNELLKKDSSLKETKIPDPKKPGEFKKVGFMTLASYLKETNSPIYQEFLESKGVKPEELVTAVVKKGKKTDEEKAAAKLEKLKEKSTPLPVSPEEPESDETIDFTLNGKEYTRLATGHAWEVKGDELVWAGVYNVITNKFDTSVAEPSA